MLRRSRDQRRWRKAVEAAVAPERLVHERDVMAAEVAKRIWQANGGPEWASAENEGSLIALETLVVRYLSEGLVRASLGLKHLLALEDAMLQGDYEDMRALASELRWAEGYLDATVFAAGGAAPDAPAEDMAEGAGLRLNVLLQELAKLVLAELRAAEIAA